MGRASNRKWAARRARIWQFLNSSPHERREGVRLLSIFGRHRQVARYISVGRTAGQ